jgi:Leucine-rich repeat (LRR) protein
MCIICSKKYNTNTTFIYCCKNVKKIPKIPKTLINLKYLYCHESQIRKIPKTLINLKNLYCENTNVKKIPKTLINLKSLYCVNTKIKFIPETIKYLGFLSCNKDVLVSPQIYIKDPNNKKYLTFTRCQVRYKLKLRLRKLKFAYDPKYIIGHNAKLQLERLFKN